MSGAADVVTVVPSAHSPIDLPAEVPQPVFAGRDGLRQAAATDAEWLWLLGDDARPAPDALTRLLEAVQPAGERPAVMAAGAVLDSRTERPIEDELSALDYTDQEAVLRLLPHRVAPMRSTSFSNCLVRRDCFGRHGLPDEETFGRHAAVVWSRRVLAEAPGYFAPLSTVHVTPRDGGPGRGGNLAAVRYVIRAGRAGAWTRGEFARILAGTVSAGRGVTPERVRSAVGP